MKIAKLFALLLAVLFFGQFKCEQYGGIPATECNTQSPLQDLDWLKQKADEITNNDDIPGRITVYDYKGEAVFLVESCYQCPDAMAYVYDCEGNEICSMGGIMGIQTCPGFAKEAVAIQVLLNKPWN